MAKEFNTQPWDPEWDDWYRLTPIERWRESMKLLEFYIAAGGSLDPEFDFIPAETLAPEPSSVSPDGRTSMRVIRRSAI